MGLSETTGWDALVFLMVFGFLLQLIGLVEGPFNIQSLFKLESVTISIGSVDIITVPYAIAVVLGEVAKTTATLLTVYLGGTTVIGLLTGRSMTTGFDFPVIYRIVMWGVLIAIFAPVFSMLEALATLPYIGTFLMIIILFLYLLAMYSIVYAHATR